MYINPNNNFSENYEAKFKEEIEAIKNIGVVKQYDKNDIVLCEGGHSDFIFFVEKGAFRGFREINNKEITLGFSFAGDFDCCPISYIQDLPSKDTIEALCPSTVIKVHKMDIESRLSKDLRIEQFTNFMLSSYVETLIGRFMELKAFTAEECYINLLKRHPKHLALVPHMYIAAYLGVTKERLSRIRKKLGLT